jgi:hypothetical protein
MILERPIDVDNENAAAIRLEAAWAVKLHRYPRLHSVDWYAERADELVGYVEIKSRTVTADHYPTVFLSMRKYLSLTMLEHTTGIAGTFVAGFSCGSLLWIRVRDVDARHVKITGRTDRGRAEDREPMILVPIPDMTVVRAS